MIDLGRWIYSNDIAEWLMNKEPLSIEEQIDCICSAPHRTVTEKLEGLKALNLLHKESQLVVILSPYLFKKMKPLF